ncbi:MAG: RNA 3'-terminal phosphate cyclase [Nitrospiraceae bacterium]|nr:RNA 3'-terminal phosphate cyclase [Nitrospiraceae bacterium]
MIAIDGNYGEGGGQILRTSLALSCLKTVPLRIFNIRGGRKRPGLMPQHLASVRAAAAISGARKLAGAAQGSTGLVFEPGPVLPGKSYSFDIGTAGSTSLLFQTLLAPLAFAGGGATLELAGGTHVPMSPPFDYIRHVFLAQLERAGLRATAEIERYGFYPRGGGAVRYSVLPVKGLFFPPGGCAERGKLLSIEGVSAVCGLPLSIALRQRDALLKAIPDHEADIRIEEVGKNSAGKGTFVFLVARYENALAGFSALGERGKPAETVGEEAARAFLEHDSNPGCLEPHLADQMLLYFALSPGRPLTFTTSRITRHLLTNLYVISRFMESFNFRVEGAEGAPGKVTLD